MHARRSPPPSLRATLLNALGIAAALLLLLAPAWWNGYPLLQYDTGGYLARYYEGYLVEARSTVFGLYLHLGEGLHFWPNLALQAALTVWILALVLRVLRPAADATRRTVPLLAVVAALTIATGLPWLVGLLLTDIFAGLAVLALHLLCFHAPALRPLERAGLVLTIAFAAASHGASLALLLALLAAAALANLVLRAVVPWRSLLQGLGAIALGAAMLLAANFALSGRLAWTPGGYELAFGRMLQDGIVGRYLKEHCPRPGLRLCAHRDELPATADAFFWDSDLFNALGRFEGLGPEMRAIVLASLAAYPAMQIEKALASTAAQLTLVATGAGVHDALPHTYGIVERFLPGEVPAMRAARQQRGKLSFDAINRIHVPAALIASVAILALLPRLRRRDPADRQQAETDSGRGRPDALATLAATVTLATLGNAAILGILSGPHDRYGARLAWLPVLVAILWAIERLARRQPGAAASSQSSA